MEDVGLGITRLMILPVMILPRSADFESGKIITGKIMGVRHLRLFALRCFCILPFLPRIPQLGSDGLGITSDGPKTGEDAAGARRKATADDGLRTADFRRLAVSFFRFRSSIFNPQGQPATNQGPK